MAYRKPSAWGYTKRIVRQIWHHPSNRHRRVRAVVGAITWQIRKRVTHRARDIAFHGWILRGYPDSNSASNVIYFTEWFDPLEMAFMASYLRPGDGFADVGANIGTYSLLARSIVGPTGHVDGFEPSSVAAARFRENVELNRIDNVTIHQAAVGATTGSAEFLVGFDVSNRVASAQDPGWATVSVPVVRLDDALDDRPFALGKLDVEGNELAALQGAEAHLRRADPPVWQVEILENQLEQAGTTSEALRGLLHDHGFSLAVYEPDRSEMRYLGPDDPHPPNVWAVHESAIEQVAERLAPGHAATKS